MFEAWKVPKRSDEVSCDFKQHLVVYMIAVGTRTGSSRMRTHTRQYSQLPCIYALFCLISCAKRTEIVPKPTMSQRTSAVQRQLLHRLLVEFSFLNLPSILGKLSISTSVTNFLRELFS